MAKAKGKGSAVTGISLPECPVCLEIMTSPIFQCQSGHSLCHLCTQNLIPPNCPMCRQPITQMRNWQLEELVDKAKVPCPNKSSGCVYTMMASEVRDHLKECIFRDMQCPYGLVFGRCSWSGSIKKLLDHFNDKHPEQCSLTLDSEIDIEFYWTPTDHSTMFLLSQGKFLFIFNMKIDTRQKMVYYVVQHIGTKRLAQQHVYEVNISSKQDNKRKAIFSDHCFSDSCDINEIFSKGQCGIMPLKMLSHFSKDNVITLKITITKTQSLFKNKPINKDNPNQQRNETDNDQNKQPKQTTYKRNPNQKRNKNGNNQNNQQKKKHTRDPKNLERKRVW